MKRFLLLIAFASSSVMMKPVLADPAPKHHEDDRDGEKEEKHGKHGHGKDNEDHYFRADDRQMIVNHYGGIQNLPPGLRRNIYGRALYRPDGKSASSLFRPSLIAGSPQSAQHAAEGLSIDTA